MSLAPEIGGCLHRERDEYVAFLRAVAAIGGGADNADNRGG